VKRMAIPPDSTSPATTGKPRIEEVEVEIEHVGLLSVEDGGR